MSIPLVQDNEKDSINTSIIAIKRNIERINMLLGLVDNDSPDLSGFATKQELQDAVTELQPVDEVTVGNMHSVSSNAVYDKVSKVETWEKEGLTLYKVGKVVCGTFIKSINTTSPYQFPYNVPWRPLNEVRCTLIDNSYDSFAGQFVIYKTGAVLCARDNGIQFTGAGYVASFCYITND